MSTGVCWPQDLVWTREVNTSLLNDLLTLKSISFCKRETEALCNLAAFPGA